MPAAPTIRLDCKAARLRCHIAVDQAPLDSVVTIEAPRRTLEQNSLLHQRLTDVARQVPWAGKKRNVEAWKDIFTAALRSAGHELDIVPGLNGGFVLLGMHTSSMSKGDCADLITLIEAWGSENGVTFKEPAQQEGVGA